MCFDPFIVFGRILSPSSEQKQKLGVVSAVRGLKRAAAASEQRLKLRVNVENSEDDERLCDVRSEQQREGADGLEGNQEATEQSGAETRCL